MALNRHILEKLYPRIKGTNYSIINNTSSEDYNCVAFSVGDNIKWWWPIGHHNKIYWPIDIKNENLNAFIHLYEYLGYEECGLDDSLEKGYEKIAIYVLSDGNTKHIAKQDNYMWKSKIGRDEIIIHTLEGLSGEFHYTSYGEVKMIMKKKI